MSIDLGSHQPFSSTKNARQEFSGFLLRRRVVLDPSCTQNRAGGYSAPGQNEREGCDHFVNHFGKRSGVEVENRKLWPQLSGARLNLLFSYLRYAVAVLTSHLDPCLQFPHRPGQSQILLHMNSPTRKHELGGADFI